MRLGPIALMVGAMVLGTPSVGLCNYYFSGEQVFNWCKSDKSDELALCVGFVAAAADSMNLSKEFKFVLTTPICIPKIPAKSLVDRATIWLEKHPKERSYPAVTSIQLAFIEMFPCGFDGNAR